MEDKTTPVATKQSLPLKHELASALLVTLTSLVVGHFTKQAYQHYVVDRPVESETNDQQ